MHADMAGAPAGAAAAAGRSGRRLRLLLLAAMLSPAALDLLISLAFVLAAGRPASLVYRLPFVALLLVLPGWLGARWLFRPIGAFLRGTADARAAAIARVRELPRLAALISFAATALFAGAAFVLGPLLLFDVPRDPTNVAILVARAATWCVLLPYTGYFLAMDAARRLRRHLFEAHGLLVPPAGGDRLWKKAVIAVVGGAVPPLMGIGTNLAFVGDTSPITGLPGHVIVLATLLGSLVALAVAAYAVTSAIAEPVGALAAGIDRIRSGDTRRKVVVETDDEVGALAQGFNDLLESLERSREESRRKEAERIVAAERFHQVQKREALGRLAGGIAHDFNNLLAIMIAYVEVVRDRLPADDRNRTRLDEALAAGDRAKRLTRQILAFSRDDASPLVPLDLRAALDQAVAWLRGILPRELTVAAGRRDVPATVKGDLTQLQQVIINLCTNASQAMGERPGRLELALERLDVDGGRASQLGGLVATPDEVPLHVERQGEHVLAWAGLLRAGPHLRLTVSDQGVGIEEGTMRQIFDPYFSTKAVGEGTGLGLSAVLGIVRRHGGAIAVASRPRRGTAFAVLLPCHDGSAGPAAEAPP